MKAFPKEGRMAKLQDYKAKDLVNILLDNCPQAFKFHGEVAMQLF